MLNELERHPTKPDGAPGLSSSALIRATVHLRNNIARILPGGHFFVWRRPTATRMDKDFR
jgi:hypothetical protein